MKRHLQPIASASEQPQRPLDGVREAREIVGPWLTTREAAVYLRYTGKHALRSVYKFLKAKRITPAYRSQRSLLIAKADLDRALKLNPVVLIKRSA